MAAARTSRAARTQHRAAAVARVAGFGGPAARIADARPLAEPFREGCYNIALSAGAPAGRSLARGPDGLKRRRRPAARRGFVFIPKWVAPSVSRASRPCWMSRRAF
ncbi:RNA helicase [Burkholderia pseudomallei]|uniref:RNA helicase n=1 Tax=Burkholderia pseudomallei TaxID=28450 RepID=UPI001050D7C5|nr:RNA helicase [Burkholderia pseudomallei]QBP57573.1 RNA helicase [Burkholderia pseudomallei]